MTHFDLDEKMTKEELQDLFGEKRCKPEPVEPCEDSKHGCCPDNFHSAKGPFFEGNTLTKYIFKIFLEAFKFLSQISNFFLFKDMSNKITQFVFLAIFSLAKSNQKLIIEIEFFARQNL